MDLKFARIQYPKLLDWSQVKCRANKYHLKSIFIILFIGSFGFFLVENSNQVQDGPWNNYGIDCDIVQKYLKGELKEEFTYRDVQIQVQHHMFSKDKETIHSTFQHRPLLNCLEADNPHLSHVLREDLMVKPNRNLENYNLRDINATEFDTKHQIEDDKKQQAKDVMEMIFKDKKHGFFVEAGAYDCEISVTLPLEYHYGWTGLLVEPMPMTYNLCKQVHRQAHLIHTCLGTKETPYFSKFDFDSAGDIMTSNTTAISTTAGFASQERGSVIEMQCFPLYSLLLAMGNPTVNLFVLDIEGFELAVLESIPWDKVDIEVLDVETDLAGIFQKDSSTEKIRKFMDEKGYERFSHRNDFNVKTGKPQNDLYVRRDIVKKYNVKQIY